MGNLIAIRRSAAGASATLMTAGFRDAGRPKERRVIVGAGPNELLRQYNYDDETGVGRLTEMQVFSGGQIIAGSRVTWNGLLRASEQQLGIAGGERYTSWAYDDRGRLTGMIAGTAGPAAVPLPGVAGSVMQGLTDADFMTEIARTPASATGALPSVQFTPKAGSGHKVGTVTRGAASESILYQKVDGTEGGSVRTEDASFRYEWDARGNLRSVTEKILSPTQPALTRVVYSYNAFDRMVGRRVETATLTGGTPPAASDWKLSTETSTAPGALPPSVTFVWDPLSDQLVAMFEAEKYESGSGGPNGRPPPQFIHGGLGLDDPIEVAVADASAPNGVKRYYPILDEAGAGSLQAVVGESGELVARTILADPFGEDASTITGPAVDRVTISGSKDASGAATEVKVEMHLTEPVDAATIASGTRLAAVTSSGAVVATSAITPVLTDGYTVRWTLPAAEWNALASSSGAVSLSIAATNTLRSTTFGSSTAVLVPRSAPSGVFASAERPFELREPLAVIAEEIANAPSGGAFSATPYSVLSIATIGTRGTTDIGASLVFSPFKAHPFSDPFTGWDYVRARWMDRASGVFLTPDPVGYRDSSNLYAFCGGDPVNCSDPDGLQALPKPAPVRPPIRLAPPPGEVVPFPVTGAAKGGSVAVPVAVGLAGGLLANWSINRWADLVDLDADVYVAEANLRDIEIRNAARQRQKAKRHLLPGASPYRQQMESLPDGMVVDNFVALHNEEVVRQRTVPSTANAKNLPLRVRFGPMNPGPLSRDIESTFRSGTYDAVLLNEPTVLYRSYSDPARKLGPFWTRTKPTGPLQTVIDSALDQTWGNAATDVVTIRVPAGQLIYEGPAAPQGDLVGGGNQVYIRDINPSWEIKR